MVDVTGAPVPTGGSPFDVPGDLAALAGHFGDDEFFSVATASSLPSSGNWPGRLLMARDTGVLYRCVALPGTWRAITRSRSFSRDMADSLLRRTGWVSSLPTGPHRKGPRARASPAGIQSIPPVR